ncbi:MAG: hydroxyacid dehydrogenase [Chthoniobacterales bacterium]
MSRHDSKPRVLVAITEERRQGFLPNDLLNRLNDLVEDVRMYDPELRYDNWEKELADYEPGVIVSGWGTPRIPVWPQPKLDYVCHLTGEVRNTIPRELIERGLMVTNWGTSISRTVAECTLMLTLCALRRVTQFALGMHVEKQWKTTDSAASLFGRRIGIHGFGNIAREYVKLAKPFGCSVSSYDPYVSDSVLRQHGVQRCNSLEELFSTSQIIIELAANTEETRRSVTGELLRMLPPDGVFVNTGRSAVVDTEALVEIAREGNLQVALDVFDEEPLSADNPLRGLHNVTLLPHIAGPTTDRLRDCGEAAVRNITKYIHGEPLDAVITLDVYDRIS